MGLFSGGLTFGSFFVYQIVGLIFGWANFQVGLLSGVYGILLHLASILHDTHWLTLEKFHGHNFDCSTQCLPGEGRPVTSDTYASNW